MKNQKFTFDYHAGTVRRDFLNEGEKTIFVKKAPVNKVDNKGIVASVRNLFGRK